jgi:glycosyltransferase involved in cell wall biosynthesis
MAPDERWIVNIGIGFYMGGAERDGIGWSMTHLLHHLLRVESRHAFTVFTNLPAAAVRAEFGCAVDVVSFRMRTFTLWEQIGLPLALARRNIDVFHSPLGLPLISGAKGLATIHDLCFLTHRATFTPRMWLYFRLFLPLAVRRARIVLTVSEASKRALCELLAVSPTKIRVVRNGVTDDFRPTSDGDALECVRKRYGLPAEFMLYVGTLEPRKNVLRLLQACQRLWAGHGVMHKLVLVGRQGWMFQETFDFIAQAGLQDRVLVVGYVARADLPAIYALASVFVYPSLCEGFGLPPLEAMACGSPVVASNTSAMPEVLGQAARLVDPLDVEALTKALRDLLGNADLRATLRRAGLERARSYRWETSARQMLEVYEELERSSP